MRRQIEFQVVNPLLRQFGLPAYATAGAAGMDLVGGGHTLIGTGLALHIQDPALVAIVASRSGLAWRHQVRVAQGIGVIDSDYHGEIKVILQNDGAADYRIEPGERIAQLLFIPVEQVKLLEVTAFSKASERGEGGFGHTGRY